VWPLRLANAVIGIFGANVVWYTEYFSMAQFVPKKKLPWEAPGEHIVSFFYNI
jgi:hypothetical protein